ncbi:hypothetical protein DYB34_000657, partial [Aphanomyces astaci]
QYRVETGDVSSKLDYSSTSALTLNGGTIMTTPTLAGRSPVQPANPQLNPPGGALSGVRIIQASLGRVSYIDLGIDTMGLKYVIYFSTPPDIVASVMFDVTYSAVWEVRNSPINVHNRGDKTGWSVDVNGAVAIVGSAGAMAKQYNVQEITAWGSATSYVDEVQYVQTTCVHRDAIQVLVSSVAPGETVGGYFSLMYGAVGPTRRLAADFDAVQLEVALQLDFGLPDSGVEVSREQNTYCGCTNAYQWTITFHTQGDVPTLVARNYLTGNGATIGDGKGGASAMVITRPPVVSGQFALRYGTITTQNMPSNVDATTMAARLALDLSLPIRSVARSEPTIQNGYTWSITFSSSSTLFNINELQPAPVFLTGNQVLLTVTTVREGQAPLYGNFRLGLGNEATVDIPVTAPDTTMKAALESLSQIKTVHVARSPQNPFGGYTWTVTFIEINTLTIYGLVLSNLGTLPPLTPITLVHNVPILLGSDAAILVDYAGVNPSLYSSAVQGNAPGESAGSATVFVPYNKQWVQSALLVGSDTHVGDQFGASVALSLTGAQAVVGAPYAAALQATIASLLKVQAQFIQVVPYATLCTGAVIVITLATPDLSDPTGNIPELVADASLLTNGGATSGTVAIQSVVQGSLREDGPKAKGTPCGGAYFFSSPSAGVWTQVVKVTPTQGSETLSSEFGASVSLEGNFAAVGAPGAGYAKGEVYVYQFNGVTWSLKLTVSPYVSVQGDRFGDAVKVSDTTIVVGAPGYAGTVGAVFVFQLVNGVFVNRQQLQPGDLAIGDFFGSAVAVDMQTSTIAVSSKWHNRRGAVYVYYSPDLFFSLQQIVQGSDLRQHDGFGQSVAIVKNVLVVGANERFNSNRGLTIRKAIQTITTSASSSLGNTFRVGFRMVADGVEVDYVMFGNAVSLSRNGYHAIVGAYNADTLFSAINSGAAYLFDMGFLDFRFSSPTYSVLEGASVAIPVQRCGAFGTSCIMKTTTTLEFVDFDTGDAITDMAGQNRVPALELKYIGPYQQLCILDVTADTPGAQYYPNVMGPEPYPLVPKGRFLMPSMIGTAQSRAQSYGSTTYRSVWVDAQFDYLGVSDYTPSNGELSFPPQTISSTFVVSTTDDSVYEYPDETINIRLSVPGMWPTFPSQLWSKITILDNGDGGMGTASYSARLTGDVTPGSRMGESVAFFDGVNLAVVGAPLASVGGVECGVVFVYNSRSGVWTLEAKIIPEPCTPGRRFGTSVAIDGSYGTLRLVVGSPGPPTPSAVVYRRSSALRVWSVEVTFSEPQAISITDNYAGRGAVSIHGSVIVVGASGLEVAFVYTYTTAAGWLPSVQLRANDYVVDQVNLLSLTHVFQFGASVAINRRAIVVGAPKANYGPQRVLDVDFWSMGAAYMYYLPAQVQVVTLVGDSLLTSGEFTLSNGVTTTNPLSYQITATEMVAVLKALVSDIEVSRTGDIVKGFAWSITFISEVTNQPLLVPAWRGNGCSICIAFSSGYAANPTGQVAVVEASRLGTWTFHTQLTASDANHADRFGHSVALDGNAVIVGAYTSSALTTTTWNFETGDLTGWIKTGTAFDTQPTFGDNVMARGDVYKTYETSKGTIQHEGRYWIGTFESRPGAGSAQRVSPFTCSFANDDCKTAMYKEPGSSVAGTTQGDDPQGTLSSQVFTIGGSRIRFRLGGGCNPATIYVELLVDGLSVRRETGKCDERMRVVAWNVTMYKGKSAIVRIVDASSTDLWGHINVDDFQFDWSVEQASTGTAGVAYVFQRQATLTSFSPCNGLPKLQCFWVMQSRLVASDKRPQDQFGFSVAVDDSVGTAVIGAYHQPGVDLNNSIVLAENTGSVYLFSRIDAVKDGAGNVLSPPKWLGKETAKFQSSDKTPAAQWGYAVALNGARLAVGSPGVGGGAGCGYVFDTRFLQISFAVPEVGVLENVASGQVIVVVIRSGDLSAPLTIGYATSDRSAVGIDSDWYTACLGMMIQNRVRCGDYVQTRGELTFNVGESNKVIAVSIVDDWCYEQYPKYIALRLNVLGGDVLLGEQFAMVIRIDDDDFGRDTC